MLEKVFIFSVLASGLFVCPEQIYASTGSFEDLANRSLEVCKHYCTPGEIKLARSTLVQAQKLSAADAKLLHTANRQLIDRLADDALYHAHNDMLTELPALRFETLLQIDEITYGPDSPQLVWALNRLGIHRQKMFGDKYNQAERQKAEELLQRAMKIIQKAHMDDTSETYLNLATQLALYQYAQDWQRVEELSNRLLGYTGKSVPSNQYGKDRSVASVYAHSQTHPPKTWELYRTLAWSQQKQGRFDQSARNYRLALSESEREHGYASSTIEADFIDMLVAQKRLVEAESVAAAAAADRQNPDYCFKRKRLADVLFKSGQFKKAAPVYDEVVKLSDLDLKNARPRNYQSQAPFEPWDQAASLFVQASDGLAECYINLKDYESARTVLQQALDVCNGFKLKSTRSFYALGPNTAMAAERRAKLERVRKLINPQ
jgi:hypothetical protein